MYKKSVLDETTITCYLLARANHRGLFLSNSLKYSPIQPVCGFILQPKLASKTVHVNAIKSSIVVTVVSKCSFVSLDRSACSVS